MSVRLLQVLRRRWRSAAPALRRARTGLLVPGSGYYLLASAPFVVVFGVIPLGLYAHSGEEWSFAPEWLLRLACVGLLALVAALVVLRLIALRFVAAARALALALFCLGVLTLLAQVYAPVAIGPLDGGEMKSDEPLWYTVLEGALLVGAVLLFRLLWRTRALAMAGLFAGALWLIAAGYLLAALWPTEEAGADALQAHIDALAAPRSCGAAGNVYHILLDMQETDAFLAALERNDWAKEFDGFDLFFNNISNYMVTINSMASYLTGTFYHAGEVLDWRRARAEGLFRNLDEHDFGIWLYGPLKSWNNPYVDVFRSNLDVYRDRTGGLEGEFYDFLSVWLTSLSPNVLTNEAIPVAARLANRLFSLLTLTHGRDRERLKGHRSDDNAALHDTGFHPVASTFLLEQLALDEAVRRPACQYVYAHAVLPHDPFVLDAQCRFVGRWRHRPQKVGGTEAFVQQTECGVRKVIGFLQVLKRLNRYDTATIVVHGDHGSALQFRTSGDTSGAKVLGRRRAALLARAQALLMIKRPHAQHPLEIVHRPTQLVDVYPTIFDLLGFDLQPGEVHGRSIYGTDQSPRETRIVFDPGDRAGSSLVEVRIDDPSDLVTSNLTVIGSPTDPTLWSAQVRAAARAGSLVTSGTQSR